MKKLIFLLLLVSSILSIQLRAQYITLPDTNLTNYLVANHPTCMVGGQLDTAFAKTYFIGSMNISNKNIHDISGIEYFHRLIELDFSRNYVTKVKQLPPNLSQLFCFDNLIDSIGSFPSTLTRIWCSTNLLDSLPSLPQALNILECGDNNLTEIPPLPPLVTYFDCSHNLLTSLPILNNNILTVYASGNLITTLSALPNGMITLGVGDNPISVLPTLPSTLQSLNCDRCNLTALPILPDSLRTLSFLSNNVTTLPILPDSLWSLICNFNPINSLPSTLPPTLRRLSCVYCQLSQLPEFPSTLRYLSCGRNNITVLPELPPYMIDVAISDNPISCLPQLKKIDNFYFTNTNVTCLPDYGQIANSSPPLSSLPLCNFYNSTGCDVFYNVTGKTYFDDNANCNFDAGDVNIRNAKVQLFKNGQLYQQAFTGGEGFYTFDMQNAPGTYETSIDSTFLPFTISCPDTGYYTSQLTATDTLFFNKDFGLKCKLGFDLGVYDILRDHTKIFRPASFHTINLVAGDIAKFYGATCANVSGQVRVVFTGPATAVSFPGLAPTNIAGNIITWDVADFGAVSLFNSFLIETQIDTFAQAGDLVCFDMSITPTTGDNDVFNNQLSHCFVVVNAYDPNNKEVYPAGYTDTSVHWLTYTINFQNTGNAPAEHVYLMDTLDSNLDESTIQLLTYSHDNYTQVLPGGIVKFNFPNINLPDSTSNEPQSHGYVRYKIKLKDNLPIGTVIENTAHIYFDFNPAIVTNTTVNTLVAPISKPVITKSSSVTCAGDTITLQTTANALYTYTWRVNGVAIPNSNVSSIVVAQTGNYTVSVTDGISANVSDVEVVTFNTLPVISFNLPSDPFCRSAQPADLSSYASPAGGTFAGQGISGADFDVSSIGTYAISYSYTDGNGCSKIEQTNVEVDECIGIVGVDGNEFGIYPNPASATISISAKSSYSGYVVAILDLNGKLHANQMLLGAETLVDIANLSQGIYVVSITANDGQLVANQKLVVIK